MSQTFTRKFISVGLSVFLLLTFLLTNFANPQSASACSLEPSFNYWYKQEFEFDQRDLPPGLEFEIHYQHNPAEGRFSFLGKTSAKTYIGRQSQRAKFEELKTGDIVEADFVDAYAIHGYASLNIGEDIYPHEALPLAGLNGESPFEKPENPPETQTFDMILFHDLEVYRVPITVTFSENPSYNPKQLAGPVNAISINHSADVIFTGVAISVDNKTTDGYLYGPAVVTVGSWLKGDGPEQITFGRYGDGADCAETIELNQPYIFFLNENGGRYSGVSTGGYGITKIPYSQHNVDGILEVVDQEPVVFESIESIFTRIEKNAQSEEAQPITKMISSLQLIFHSVRSSILFWVSLALIGGVFLMTMLRRFGRIR